ncbi:hypothetical protein K488DRAFT_86830 [Vararia minispora EC-137]|uniref:Uncharacterized protein n=1 Tax=Vararia minispora EC-137 TaxID=1314806 RepID=A0ACB8QII6_9AGAM|nr:hypothetical protein K488DRAFT_86830 [Vararia minispora EC-137]
MDIRHGMLMENFINLAKQGLEAYEGSHSNQPVSKTGGAEYNAPHHSGQFQDSDGPQFDHDEVARRAEEHGSGDRSLFHSAMGFVQQHKEQHSEPVDEDAIQEHHRQAYSERDTGSMSASSMGSAAAMQALKMFTSGGGKSSSGGNSSELISLAMAEATKLFDKSGGAASGSKQDAANSAAMTVMKLVVQSKFGGTIGGGNSGGLGSLMGIASKFM